MYVYGAGTPSFQQSYNPSSFTSSLPLLTCTTTTCLTPNPSHVAPLSHTTVCALTSSFPLPCFAAYRRACMHFHYCSSTPSLQIHTHCNLPREVRGPCSQGLWVGNTSTAVHKKTGPWRRPSATPPQQLFAIMPHAHLTCLYSIRSVPYGLPSLIAHFVSKWVEGLEKEVGAGGAGPLPPITRSTRHAHSLSLRFFKIDKIAAGRNLKNHAHIVI